MHRGLTTTALATETTMGQCRPGRKRRVMKAKRTLFAASVAAFCLAAVPAAQASTPFTFGMGTEPDLAVDSAGTAHVAWHDISRAVGQDVVLYCQIPRGARACTNSQTLYTGRIGARPHVLLPTAGQVIVVLGEDQCGVADFCTLVRRSADGGAGFGPVQTVADPEGSGSLSGPAATGDAVYGPGDSISYVNGSATAGMFFTNASLGGGVQNGFARLHTSTSAVDGTVGLAGSTPVVAFADQQSSQNLLWRAYSGSGDLNDAASWTTQQLVESGVTALNSDVTLAGGPGGLYLMYRRGGSLQRQYVVRKFTGSGFGQAVGVSERRDPIFGELAQDASGRLHAVWLANGPDRLQWRTSKDGVTWGPTVTIGISDAVFPRMSVDAAGDAGGFASWDTHRGPNGAISELEATPLEPYTGPGSGIDPRDPCAWSNCLPAPGGKPSARLGGREVTTAVSISSCQTKRVKVRLRKLKKRTGRVVVQKVVFQLGRRTITDRKPAYGAVFPLKGATLGKRYTLKATVHLRVGAKTSKLKLSKRFYACPLG